MPESIFKQVSLDILRLHQQTIRSLLATQCCNDCEVHDVFYITLDGRYYVWLPGMNKAEQVEAGILLIEDETSDIRLSWVANTRKVQKKDSLYEKVVSALQRRLRQTKNKFIQAKDTCLLELTPKQGRLTRGSRDLSLSPHDLLKALYPATHQLKSGGFAL